MNRTNGESIKTAMAGAITSATNAVGGGLGQWTYKALLVAAIVIGLCSVPFVAIGWMQSAEPAPTQTQAQRFTLPGLAPEAAEQPVAVPTADWTGHIYSNADEARNHCRVGETVLAWRGGFVCVTDMDANRQR